MIPIGIFNIDDWTDNDDNTLTIKCIDNMSKFEFNYDGRRAISESTLLTVLQDICSKAGVELGSTSFLNSNIQVATYDNTVSAREYLSYISECAGGFAFIGRDGKLYIRTIYQDEQEIALELFGEYKWGDKYKISKVSYENGVESFKFGDDTGNNLWINQENMYIVEENEVKNIYNQLKGLETYSFEGKVIIDPALDVGDKIIIDGKSVIYQGEADFQTRFISEISSKISIKQKQETTVKTTSQKVLNRRVQSSIDEINGKITQVVQETTANTEKLSKHEQTLDSITDTLSSVETTVEGTVKTIQVQYALSDSSTQAPEEGWSTVAPEWQEGKYMWQKTVTIFMNDMQIESEATCIQGANGKDGTEGKDGLGIEKLETQYYLSTSNTTVTGGSWKNTQDKWTANHYIWTRTKITWSDNSVTYSEPILAEGLNTANENANNANEGTKVVTTKMSEVEKTVDSITQTVTETTEKLNNDYSTTEQMQSAIDQKADSITSTVNNTLQDYTKKTETESMIEQSAEQIQTVISASIGTTNLVPNSDFSHQNSKGEYDLDGWTKYGNLQTENETSRNKVIVDYDKTWLSIYKETLGTYGIGRVVKPIQPDQDYTLSFKLMNDDIPEGKTRSDTIQATIYVRNSSGGNIQTLTQNFTIANTWNDQNFSYTFHTPNNSAIDNIDLRIDGLSLLDDSGGNTVFASSITNIQIELSKIATDWRPSQTDFYETVQQYSKLVQTVDTLESTVAYKDDLKETESNIKQTTDSISSTVSKKVGYDEVISSINQSAEQVQINADKISLER